MSDVIIFVQAREEGRLLYAQIGLCIRYAYLDHTTTTPLFINRSVMKFTQNMIISFKGEWLKYTIIFPFILYNLSLAF